MSKLHFSSVRLLLIFFVIPFFDGCMSIPGGLIPIVTGLPDKTAYVNKPDVYIDLSYHTFLKGQHTEPVENSAARDEFLGLVNQITEESKLFQSFSFDKMNNPEADFTIQMDMLNHGDYTMAMLAGCISGLSLTIIPMAARDNYTLTAKLLDSRGNEIKSYVYDDFVRTWFHLFLFPFSGSIKKVPDEVRANMVKKLYNDILNDNLLEYSYNQRELPEFLCLK
jgi:hypothetical protein